MTEGKYRDPHEQQLAAQRPNHPDFWRMSKVVIDQDARAENEGLGFTEEMADLECVGYLADQRVLRVQQLMSHLVGELTPQMRQVMSSLFLDAFYAGVGFQLAGGHRSRE